VAAIDLPAGTVITFDKLQQRSVPRYVVTSSFVKPDSASYIINEKIRDPVQAGDPLLWSQFAARLHEDGPVSRQPFP
jgi:pilus assembly protein CpaB